MGYFIDEPWRKEGLRYTRQAKAGSNTSPPPLLKRSMKVGDLCMWIRLESSVLGDYSEP